MRIGMIPESLVEKVGAALNLIPRPIIDVQGGLMTARAVMAGVGLGVFEALKDGPADAATLARRCGLDPQMTRALATSLVGVGYLQPAGRGFRLTPRLARWLLADSPVSVRDMILFEYDCWDIVSGYEDAVRTGRGVDIHATYGPEQWVRYTNGMRATAAGGMAEIARLVPAPHRPRTLLDIGGSHGLYSVALCRRHPGLTATILDLPDAIAAAAPLLAREGLGDRVSHAAGNALSDDLGEACYDLVIMSQLAHHFSAEENQRLARRVARALRPGGVFTVIDQIAVEGPAEARKPNRRVGALLDLFFATSSTSRTWSVRDIRGWLSGAGLAPAGVRWTSGFPLGLVSGRK